MSTQTHKLARVWQATAGRQRHLWVLAIAALVGDICITAYGLEQGLTEMNPIARSAIEMHGYAGMVVLKGLAVAVGLIAWTVVPRRFQLVIPLGLALPWVAAVLINVVVIWGFVIAGFAVSGLLLAVYRVNGGHE